MRPARRALAVLALLFGPAACGRSCGCVEGEKTYEALDGKVKVELLRKVHWAGGKIPGPITQFYLRVHTSPAVEHPITCDHVDLAEDDAGKLVAWRCAKQKETPAWNVLRLRGGPRYIADCDAPVGREKKPEWTKLDPLSRAADRIIECLPSQSTEPTAAWRELARSIEEDEGLASAAQLYARTAVRPHPESTPDDPWWQSLVLGSPALRKEVERAVCPHLERDDAPIPAYARAADLCPHDGPRVGDAAVAQLEALLARPVTLGNGFVAVRGVEHWDDDLRDAAAHADGGVDTSGYVDRTDPLRRSHARALQWAAVLAVTKRPALAGKVACDALGRLNLSDHDYFSDRPRPRGTAAAVLARSGVKCAAAAALLARVPCGADVECDGGLCSAREVDEKMDRWIERATTRDDAGAPTDPQAMPEEAVARLAIAYAQGPLDAEITVRNARRRYVWPDAGAQVSCSEPTAADGTPCTCAYRPVDLEMCHVPATDKRARIGPCAFRIDDAHRRFEDVRRACAAVGATCEAGMICCGDAECVWRPSADGGAGASVCAARAATDAGAR